jgi:hypothetical protein
MRMKTSDYFSAEIDLSRVEISEICCSLCQDLERNFQTSWDIRRVPDGIRHHWERKFRLLNYFRFILEGMENLGPDPDLGLVYGEESTDNLKATG